MHRLLLVAVGCFALHTSVALGQDSPLLIPGDRSASAEVSKIVEAATAARLPADPIVSKVHLAIVRKTPSAKIVEAAKNVAARLEEARTALAPNPSDLDVVSGQDALGYGATKDALREIRKVSGGRSIAVPLSVLAQLLSTGVKLDRATAVVIAMVRNNVTDPQMVAFANTVNADVGAGANVRASLDARIQGLAAVLGAAGSGSNFAGDAVSIPASLQGGTKSNPTPVRPHRP